MGIKYQKQAGDIQYQGEVSVSVEEASILRQCGLSVQGYLDAQLPKRWKRPVSGIQQYCFNHDWIIKRNPCTGKWEVKGRRFDDV